MAVFIALAASAAAQQPQVAPEALPLPETPREELLGPKPDWSWLATLRFVTESDYPPFNYQDEDGALTGFNVELARAICKELDVNCEINSADWGRVVDMLKKKEADAAVASIAISPRSAAELDFTNSYYQTPAKFVIKVGSNIKDVSPEALVGKKISVVQGTAHEAFLRDFYPDAGIEAFPGDAEAREALKTGKVDLLFGDAISSIFWIMGADSQSCCQFRGTGFIEAKYFGEGAGVAVARGNSRMREVLDYGLAKVRASGRFEELMLRYFPLSIY
jgi:polar amino acid transport system substrate-binding protein